ncbi:hypothetical protein [Streptomyces sp. NPDC096033]
MTQEREPAAATGATCGTGREGASGGTGRVGASGGTGREAQE